MNGQLFLDVLKKVFYLSFLYSETVENGPDMNITTH